MTPQQRAEYSVKTINRHKRFERAFLKPVYTVLKNEMRRAARALRQGNQYSMNSHDLIEGLAPKLQVLIEVVGLFYAKLTTRQISRSVEEKGFGKDQEWIDLINEYFRTELLNNAVIPISTTTRARILQMITEGTSEGKGIDEIARELEESDFPLWRAKMIVRTEILQAQNIGTRLGAEESEWETQKEWIAAHDLRVRHTHHEVDGKVVDEAGRFRVPKKKGGYDLMTGPGDPTASAGNLINCRCTSAVTAKRDENGRLIRKRKISVLLPGAIKPFRQIATI